MKRKGLILSLLSILLVLTLVVGLSLGSTSKALSGSEKVDTGAVGTHTVGWVTVTIAGHEPTYVSGGYITAPAGCTVTGGTVSVKGGTGTNTYTFTGSSFSGPLYAPKNNGGNVADVSHVTVVYYYECPTPTPDPGTPTPTPSGDPTPTPSGDPTPTPSGDPTPTPSGDPTPTPSGDPTPTPSGDPTPTPSGDPTPTPSGDPTPTPKPSEPPIPGRG